MQLNSSELEQIGFDCGQIKRTIEETHINVVVEFTSNTLIISWLLEKFRKNCLKSCEKNLIADSVFEKALA